MKSQNPSQVQTFTNSKFNHSPVTQISNVVIFAGEKFLLDIKEDTTIGDIKEFVLKAANVKEHVSNFSVFRTHKCFDSPEKVRFTKEEPHIEPITKMPNWATLETMINIMQTLQMCKALESKKFIILDSNIFYDIFVRRARYNFGEDFVLIITDTVAEELWVQESFLRDRGIIHLKNVISRKRVDLFSSKCLGKVSKDDRTINSKCDFEMFLEACACNFYLKKIVPGCSVGFATRNHHLIQRIKKSDPQAIPTEPVEFIEGLQAQYKNCESVVNMGLYKFNRIVELLRESRDYEEFVTLVLKNSIIPKKEKTIFVPIEEENIKIHDPGVKILKREKL